MAISFIAHLIAALCSGALLHTIYLSKQKACSWPHAAVYITFLLLQTTLAYLAVAEQVSWTLMALLAVSTTWIIGLCAWVGWRAQSSSGFTGITLAELVRQMPCHVYWKDWQGRCRGTNQMHAESLGYASTSDLLDKLSHNLIEQPNADEVRRVDYEVLQEGVYQIKEENDLINGEVRTRYLSHKKPLFDHQGHIRGLIGISIDVSDIYKSITTEIKALKNIINMLPGSIYWLDRSGRYLGCNQNTAKLINLASAEDMIGKRNCELPHGMSTEAIDRINDSVMRTGNAITTEEKAKLPSGEEIVTLSTKAPLKDDDGRIIGMIGISQDITERKQVELELRATQTKLEQANIAKSEFIANMSHDLRTPITCIIGMADKLSQNQDDGQRQQYANLLGQSCQELLKLLNDFIDVAQVESGTNAVIHRRFMLREVLDGCIRLIAPMIDGKNIKMLVEYDMAIPEYLIGDPHRTTKILNNLLSNAIKFTEQGHVRIKARLVKLQRREVLVSLIVEDSGIGIPADKQDVIFNRFSRLTSAYQGIYKGTGVGLNIVKQFIDDLSGNIDVRSQPGKGSTFICTIPFEKPLLDHMTDNEASPENCDRYVVDNTPKASPSLKKRLHPSSKNKPPSLHVLLVEDNLVAQTIAKDKLVEAGCHVDCVASGEKSIEQAQTIRYDLIFMDIGLPGNIDGCEASKEIHTWEKNQGYQTPIIALTAHADDQQRQRCLDAGMTAVLHKPLTPELAKEVISKYGPSK